MHPSLHQIFLHRVGASAAGIGASGAEAEVTVRA
jgi:hypothetical protein